VAIFEHQKSHATLSISFGSHHGSWHGLCFNQCGLWLQPGRQKFRDFGGGLGNPTGLPFFWGGFPLFLIFRKRNGVSFTQRTQRSQRGSVDAEFLMGPLFRSLQKNTDLALFHSSECFSSVLPWRPLREIRIDQSTHCKERGPCFSFFLLHFAFVFVRPRKFLISKFATSALSSLDALFDQHHPRTDPGATG